MNVSREQGTHSTPTPVRYFAEAHPLGQIAIRDVDSATAFAVLPNEVYRFSDTGYASPAAMTPTAHAIPAAEAMARQNGIPLAVTLSPLASLDNMGRMLGGCTNPPLIRHRPVRCRRCRSYFCAAARINRDGWECGLCGRQNTFPPEVGVYYDSTSGAYVPSANWEGAGVAAPETAGGAAPGNLPEYHRGTVEYLVNTDLQFLPSTVDREGLSFSQLSPAEVTHVQASVLSNESVRDANFQALGGGAARGASAAVASASRSPAGGPQVGALIVDKKWGGKAAQPGAAGSGSSGAVASATSAIASTAANATSAASALWSGELAAESLAAVTTQGGNAYSSDPLYSKLAGISPDAPTASQARLEGRDRLVQFIGTDTAVPGSERLLERRLPTSAAEQGSEALSSVAAKEVSSYYLPYTFVVLLPVTRRSVYSGALGQAVSTLISLAPALPEKSCIVPVFYGKTVSVFTRTRVAEDGMAGESTAEQVESVGSGGETAVPREERPPSLQDWKITEAEMPPSGVSEEPVLPAPIPAIAIGRKPAEEALIYGAILSALYKRIQLRVEAAAPGSEPASDASGDADACCFGSALAGAVSTLQRTGGRIVALLCDRPNCGMGALDACLLASSGVGKDGRSLEAMEYSHHVFYNRLAREAADHNVCVDVVALPVSREALGLYALSVLPLVTSGSLYHNATAAYMGEAMLRTNGNAEFAGRCLVALLTRSQGLAASVSIRCSEGLTISSFEDSFDKGPGAAGVVGSLGGKALGGLLKSARGMLTGKLGSQRASDAAALHYKFTSRDAVYGSYLKVSELEFAFAGLDDSKSFSVELSYLGKLPTDGEKFAYVQSAVLYTAPDGSRRVRVSTLPLRIEERVSECFNGTNQAGIVSHLARKAAFAVLNAAPLVAGYPAAFGGSFACPRPRVRDAQSAAVPGGAGAPAAPEADATQGSRSKSSQPIFQDFQTGQANVAFLESMVSRYGSVDAGSGSPFVGFFDDGAVSLAAVREAQPALEQTLVRLLSRFRELCMATSTRLVVPETLQLLPMYVSCLYRTGLMHGNRGELEGGAFSSDLRAVESYFYLTRSPADIMLSLYPSIYDLKDYAEAYAHAPNVQEDPGRNMPICVPWPSRACSRYLVGLARTCYLITTPRFSFIWVGSLLEESFRQALFGVRAHSDLRVESFPARAPEGADQELFGLVNAFVTHVENFNGCLSRTVVVPEGCRGPEALCRWCLVEDATTLDKQHGDFLAALQAKIQ